MSPLWKEADRTPPFDTKTCVEAPVPSVKHVRMGVDVGITACTKTGPGVCVIVGVKELVNVPVVVGLDVGVPDTVAVGELVSVKQAVVVYVLVNVCDKVNVRQGVNVWVCVKVKQGVKVAAAVEVGEMVGVNVLVNVGPGMIETDPVTKRAWPSGTFFEFTTTLNPVFVSGCVIVSSANVNAAAAKTSPTTPAPI